MASIDMDLNVTLTEDDIPGARLDMKNLEKHTIPELRWWLLCRGISLRMSLKKTQIRENDGLLI